MNLRPLVVAAVALACLPALAQHESHAQHAGHDMAMTGALGPYPMSREASGTSWQPEAAAKTGIHGMAGEWMTMLHGYADLVYDDQGGPRGDEKVFVPSMLMLMGQRSLGPGTWGLRSMISLDPLMGSTGYPLLFQTGETGDGVEPLVDRQHPHDFFMELATTYSVPLGNGSVFGYAGLPGEPALGPPAFMHRASGVQIPEAPLSHHWLDSTHITFGVATLGATAGHWKLEASAFNAREPDHNRWNIETGRLDSWSGRVTLNPAPQWSAQLSHGHLESPEQLHPDEDVDRTTASIGHARGPAAEQWSTTLAAGSNRAHGHDQPAYAVESTRRFAAGFTLFARAEILQNSELFHEGPLAGEEFRIAKISLGGLRRIGAAGPLAFDAGALGSAYRVPDALEGEYGSSPLSFMVFVRTSIESSP
jgi:hypothetical protein